VNNNVLVQITGGTIVVTINRPQVRNAIDRDAALAIESAMDTFDETRKLLVGILTGSDGTFCSGMDLKSFASGELPHGHRRGFGGLAEHPPAKPLIAAVEGYALAGGFELVLACDLVVASEDAVFGLPEVTRGLCATGGGLVRLPERIPRNHAMQLALTGEPLPARRAAELGLVNLLVPPGTALAHADALAKTILRNGPLAVAASKRVIEESPGWPGNRVFDAQKGIADAVRNSADAREGARAFVEKRKPVWRGV
jgi:enoyl-CoA hydratase